MCQIFSTEEGIHSTLQVSEISHINTAEKTGNRGWRDEQILAGFRGVTTRQEYFKPPSFTTLIPHDNGQ